MQVPYEKKFSMAEAGTLDDENMDLRTSVLQPKSNPAILTPANLTPAAAVRAAPKAKIEPARSFEMECIVE